MTNLYTHDWANLHLAPPTMIWQTTWPGTLETTHLWTCVACHLRLITPVHRMPFHNCPGQDMRCVCGHSWSHHYPNGNTIFAVGGPQRDNLIGWCWASVGPRHYGGHCACEEFRPKPEYVAIYEAWRAREVTI